MKEKIIEIILLFITYNTIQFWLSFKDLEENKQIKLKDFIFKEEKKK